MHLGWLLVATSVILVLDARASDAQIAASATIKAQVRPEPKKPRGPGHDALVASPLLILDGPVSRVRMWTPTGESIALELEGMTTSRVSFIVSDLEAATLLPPIECHFRAGDFVLESRRQRHVQASCEELVIRWLDAPTWPALLSIASSIDATALHAGKLHFTIVAEY